MTEFGKEKSDKVGDDDSGASGGVEEIGRDETNGEARDGEKSGGEDDGAEGFEEFGGSKAGEDNEAGDKK